MRQPTQQEIRIKFAHYFLHLRETMKAEGAHVSKTAEWTTFIQHLIDEAALPPEAARWPCPRSLEAELRKQTAG